MAFHSAEIGRDDTNDYQYGEDVHSIVVLRDCSASAEDDGQDDSSGPPTEWRVGPLDSRRGTHLKLGTAYGLRPAVRRTAFFLHDRQTGRFQCSRFSYARRLDADARSLVLALRFNRK